MIKKNIAVPSNVIYQDNEHKNYLIELFKLLISDIKMKKSPNIPGTDTPHEQEQNPPIPPMEKTNSNIDPYNLRFPISAPKINIMDPRTATFIAHLGTSVHEAFDAYKRNEPQECKEKIHRGLITIPLVYQNCTSDIKNELKEIRNLATVLIKYDRDTRPISLLTTFILKSVPVPTIFNRILDHISVFTKPTILQQKNIKEELFLAIILGSLTLNGDEIKHMDPTKKEHLLSFLDKIIIDGSSLSKDNYVFFKPILWAYCLLVGPLDLRDKLGNLFESILKNQSYPSDWRIPFQIMNTSRDMKMLVSPDLFLKAHSTIISNVRNPNQLHTLLNWQSIVVRRLQDNHYGNRVYIGLASDLFLKQDFKSYETHFFYTEFLKRAVLSDDKVDLERLILQPKVKENLIYFENIEKIRPNRKAMGFDDEVFFSAVQLRFMIALGLRTHTLEEIYSSVKACIEKNPNIASLKPLFANFIGELFGYVDTLQGHPFSELEQRITTHIHELLDSSVSQLSYTLRFSHDSQTIIDDDFILLSLQQPLGYLNITYCPQSGTSDQTQEIPIYSKEGVRDFLENLASTISDLPIQSFNIQEPIPTQESINPPSIPLKAATPSSTKRTKTKTRKTAIETKPDAPPIQQNLHTTPTSPVTDIIRNAFSDCIRRGIKVRTLKTELNTYFKPHASQYNIRIEDAPGGEHRHLKISWTEHGKNHSVEVAAGHIKHSEYNYSLLRKIANELTAATQRTTL